jgi:hypothetical protein
VFWYDDRINEEFKSSDVNVTSKLMPDGKRWEVRSVLKFTPTKDHDGQNLTCSVMNSAAAGNPLKASIKLNVSLHFAKIEDAIARDIVRKIDGFWVADTRRKRGIVGLGVVCI